MFVTMLFSFDCRSTNNEMSVDGQIFYVIYSDYIKYSYRNSQLFMRPLKALDYTTQVPRKIVVVQL